VLLRELAIAALKGAALIALLLVGRPAPDALVADAGGAAARATSCSC
jgi:hypothetical protein